MCFDETEEIIEGAITQAFSDLDIKKKINTHSRKDLFWAAFPSNATRLVQQKKYLMSLLIGLEASVLITYEGNNQSLPTRVFCFAIEFMVFLSELIFMMNL